MNRYGSDVIIDLLIEAGIEHVAFNPGASFRGIHDSLVNTDGALEHVLCLHEAIAVSVAQGYAKAKGRPMAVLLHDVVGLQNASMAIYNAWCDRAAILLIGGTGPKSKATRRPWIDWIHTANTQANLVRDFVKWDDEPHDIESVAESLVRALTAARTSPPGPVYLCYDVDLQENELPDDYQESTIRSFAQPTDPVSAPGALDAIAETLRCARRPAILTGYVGEDEASFAALGQLAEILAAPVFDTGARLALPSTHPLNASGTLEILEQSDVVLVLDVDDLRGPLGKRLGDTHHEGEVAVLRVGVGQLRLRGWSQDYQELVPSRLDVTGSAAAAVHGLIARLGPECLDPARRGDLERRIADSRARRRAEAVVASSPGAVPLERLIIELDIAIDGRPFVLTNGTTQPLDLRLLTLEHPRQAIGWGAGGGLGYGLGGAIGAALADPDKISVDIQSDGDLLYLPSALWTAAHLKLPVLVVLHNNRQYANTVGHAQRIAAHRGRSLENRHAGAAIDNPFVDMTKLASSLGVWAAPGPLEDASTLQAALEQAIQQVQGGRPALIDVSTPPI